MGRPWYQLAKKQQVVAFSATAIALYGYDQGMMSLINTNYDYLSTMGIAEESPIVGIIVSVYYLGCTLGAILFSIYADQKGRRPSLFCCLATSSLGNLIMFIAGLKDTPGALYVMLVGRVIMGIGVGGIDAVVPVYSSELSDDDERGVALAKEFQANIAGLNIAFILNVVLTNFLGKSNQWSWRIPIIAMQVFPLTLISFASTLPETPRWLVLHGKDDRARQAIIKANDGDDSSADEELKELQDAHKKEQEDGETSYADMIWPSGSQFHPTVITVMGQVNQALTGYGAVSVYGPQIFQLLGFGVMTSEYLTLGNYVSYFGFMTFAWLLIDTKGRRWLMLQGSFWLFASFALLTLLGGLAHDSDKGKYDIPLLATGIPGIVTLYFATAMFGIGWLVPPWLIPTEIYPSTARAQGSSISVIIWGLANFAVTLLTPIGFNNLKYWLFLVFAVTNAFAGWWTWKYIPESGARSFEDNQQFFGEAAEKGSWSVKKVKKGEYLRMPDQEDEESSKKKNADGETEPLLQRVVDTVRSS